MLYAVLRTVARNLNLCVHGSSWERRKDKNQNAPRVVRFFHFASDNINSQFFFERFLHANSKTHTEIEKNVIIFGPIYVTAITKLTIFFYQKSRRLTKNYLKNIGEYRTSKIFHRRNIGCKK